MNENLYIAHKKLPHKTLHVHSTRYTHTVHTCKILQAKNYQRTLTPKSTNSKRSGGLVSDPILTSWVTSGQSNTHVHITYIYLLKHCGSSGTHIFQGKSQSAVSHSNGSNIWQSCSLESGSQPLDTDDTISRHTHADFTYNYQQMLITNVWMVGTAQLVERSTEKLGTILMKGSSPRCSKGFFSQS